MKKFILAINVIALQEVYSVDEVVIEPDYTGVEPKLVMKIGRSNLNLAWNNGGALFQATTAEADGVPSVTGPWEILDQSGRESIRHRNVDLAFFTVQGQSDESPDFVRPAGRLYLPSSYDGSEALPLFVLFHYFSVQSRGEKPPFEGGLDENLPLKDLVDSHDFMVYAPHAVFHPDSVRGPGYVWNATEECCVFDYHGRMIIDDVGHVRSGLNAVIRDYNVDLNRIWTFGGANGGGMAAVYAVRDSRVAGYIGLNPYSWGKDEEYVASHPLHSLAIHTIGNSFRTYEGGATAAGFDNNGDPYSVRIDSAITELTKRGRAAGLSFRRADLDNEFSLDLELNIAGRDTRKRIIEDDTGSDPETLPCVELWEIGGNVNLWLNLRDESGKLATQFPAAPVEWALERSRID